jgi:hypothetical protein
MNPKTDITALETIISRSKCLVPQKRNESGAVFAICWPYDEEETYEI